MVYQSLVVVVVDDDDDVCVVVCRYNGRMHGGCDGVWVEPVLQQKESVAIARLEAVHVRGRAVCQIHWLHDGALRVSCTCMYIKCGSYPNVYW